MSQAQTEYGLEATACTELTESEQHRLLADERRQVVLEVLPEQGSELPLEELATAVHEQESDDSGNGPTGSEDVAVSLHHVHLPILDDLGVLDYDADSHCVAVQ